MVRALGITGCVAAQLAIGVGDSAACDRAISALETPAVAVAVADVVLAGTVTSMVDGVATVKIASTLKGAGNGISPGDSVQVRGVIAASALDDGCGGVPIDTGKQYVFTLWSPAGSLGTFHVVDENGGVAAYSVASEKLYRDALAKQHPHSAWKIAGDIATRLVRSPSPSNQGDVDLFVVLRNIGTKPVEYTYREWPRAAQSRCALTIVNTETKKRIAPKRVPIANKDITDYFSKAARTWQTAIAPGDAYLHHLYRVTTAQRGWGYKQELGFLYYPVATPGEHVITADCANLFGRSTRSSTAGLTLTL
jgi:hypothetical protein